MSSSRKEFKNGNGEMECETNITLFGICMYAGSGDPNVFGDGTVSVNAGQAQICYNLRVFVYPGDGSNWPPTSTGIYQAAAGSNGPLVVDLHPDFSSGPNASGCVGISSTLAHDIQRSPSRYYILVTSINHPDGAVRAQLVI
jgi:hypothetical protein